jgi:hypothetical protein
VTDTINVGDRVSFLFDGGAETGEVIAIRGSQVVVEFGGHSSVISVIRRDIADVCKGVYRDIPARESISEFAGRVYKVLRIRELEAELARLREP